MVDVRASSTAGQAGSVFGDERVLEIDDADDNAGEAVSSMGQKRARLDEGQFLRP